MWGLREESTVTLPTPPPPPVVVIEAAVVTIGRVRLE